MAADPDNPPVFRGSDFAMRWLQGQWSEERILASINVTDEFRAVAYGRSDIGPEDKEEIAEYWRSYASIETVGKRPDLLMLARSDYDALAEEIDCLGDLTLRSDEELAPILEKSICGIEAENSLWVGRQMPHYGTETITRLDFKAPTVIVKEEDAPALLAWQSHFNIPVVVVHCFYDDAFAVTLDFVLESIQDARKVEADRLAAGDTEKQARTASRARQKELGVLLREQKYGDSTKTIYRTHYSRAALFGRVDPDNSPVAKPEVMIEPNGKILAYVAFSGGVLVVEESGLEFFRELAESR